MGRAGAAALLAFAHSCPQQSHCPGGCFYCWDREKTSKMRLTFTKQFKGLCCYHPRDPTPTCGPTAPGLAPPPQGPSRDQTSCSLLKPNEALDNTFLWLWILKTKPKIPWKAKRWKKRENKQYLRPVWFITTDFPMASFVQKSVITGFPSRHFS